MQGDTYVYVYVYVYTHAREESDLKYGYYWRRWISYPPARKITQRHVYVRMSDLHEWRRKHESRKDRKLEHPML